jgi:hypothetical protein
MEKIIERIDEKYDMDIKSGNNFGKMDKIYLFNATDLLKKNDNTSGEELALNFSNMEIGDMIKLINNSFSLKQSYFNNMLYQILKEKDFLKLIEEIKIPSSNQEKIITYIKKFETKLKNKIWENFIKNNSESLTEDIIIKLIKEIDSDNLIQLIIGNIPIDSEYALEIMKENENYFLDNEDIKKINKSIKSIENINYGWIEFMKNVNLIGLLKLEINETEYETYEQILKEKNKQINQKLEKENLNTINLKETIDLTLINKFTNQNKSTIIKEKILI